MSPSIWRMVEGLPSDNPSVFSGVLLMNCPGKDVQFSNFPLLGYCSTCVSADRKDPLIFPFCVGRGVDELALGILNLTVFWVGGRVEVLDEGREEGYYVEQLQPPPPTPAPSTQLNGFLKFRVMNEVSEQETGLG